MELKIRIASPERFQKSFISSEHDSRTPSCSIARPCAGAWHWTSKSSLMKGWDGTLLIVAVKLPTVRNIHLKYFTGAQQHAMTFV